MSSAEGLPADTEPRVYRMAQPIVARLLGAFLVLMALVLFASTALVYATGLPGDLLLVPLVVAVGGSLGLGWWLRRGAWVLRLDAEGYAVRLVRGAQVRDATWGEVRGATTTTPRGHPCLVLTLRDDRQTVIPVEVLAGDREELVREVQRRLRASRTPNG